MFGGNGEWLHTYIGGIDNAAGSIGFEHARIGPPAALVEQAQAFELAKLRGGRDTLAAAAAAGTTSPPLRWSSA